MRGDAVDGAAPLAATAVADASIDEAASPDEAAPPDAADLAKAFFARAPRLMAPPVHMREDQVDRDGG